MGVFEVSCRPRMTAWTFYFRLPIRSGVDDGVKTSVSRIMENAAVVTLSGICLGIGLSGLLAVVVRQGRLRERISLGLAYIAFMGMIALPLVKTFAAAALINYIPLLLIMLLVLPPAFFHFVSARTATDAPPDVPWHHLVMPLVGGVVSIGFWLLPTEAKNKMFIMGELPSGVWPATLALLAFALILLWLVTSFAYLVAILRRLTAYRARIRHLYSDAEDRDMRWVDVVMALLVLVWAVGAFSLADENLADGTFFVEELFLTLIAGGLLVLNVFAAITPTYPGTVAEEDAQDLKYARSGLTDDHAAKLADRVETAMRKDALYLDPGLSLQKLSRHVGALPNQISQTLNQEIGATFFDYVAGWRIEASKPLIMAGDASVLAVALEVGFNSRSSFYKSFKRETGMTPKAYRASKDSASE